MNKTIISIQKKLPDDCVVLEKKSITNVNKTNKSVKSGNYVNTTHQIT